MTIESDRSEPDDYIKIDAFKNLNDILFPLVYVYKNGYKKYPQYAEDNAIEYLKSLWNENNPDILVAHDDKEIKGFIIVEDRGIIGEVHEFVIDSNFHGKKLGSKLFEVGLNYLKNTQKIILSVGRNNKPAYKLYSKHGFKIVAIDGKWIEMEKTQKAEQVAVTHQYQLV